MEDEYVDIEVKVYYTSSQPGRAWLEVPKSIFDQGKEAVDKFIRTQELVDVNWDCEEGGDIEIEGWDLA